MTIHGLDNDFEILMLTKAWNCRGNFASVHRLWSLWPTTACQLAPPLISWTLTLLSIETHRMLQCCLKKSQSLLLLLCFPLPYILAERIVLSLHHQSFHQSFLYQAHSITGSEPLHKFAMASSTSPKAPSFVFEYLPKPTTASSRVTDATSPSLYDRTSSFLSSFAKAVTPSPQLSMNERRHATLAQVKAAMEGHLAAKRTAGIAVSAGELDDVVRIRRAMQGLGKDA